MDVGIFCFRLHRLKTLVLKNHFVSEVGPFLRDRQVQGKANKMKNMLNTIDMIIPCMQLGGARDFSASLLDNSHKRWL